MGYTTDFDGVFTLNKKLEEADQQYLAKFSRTRRMKRDREKLLQETGIDYGVDGEFYVDGDGDFGQGNGGHVVNHNSPPATQPGLWCQWVPTRDGQGIEWDQGEKFYNYVEWLKYIIKVFLEPKGYVLNGEVSYRGEDRSDHGYICVENNVVTSA